MSMMGEGNGGGRPTASDLIVFGVPLDDSVASFLPAGQVVEDPVLVKVVACGLADGSDPQKLRAPEWYVLPGRGQEAGPEAPSTEAGLRAWTIPADKRVVRLRTDAREAGALLFGRMPGLVDPTSAVTLIRGADGALYKIDQDLESCLVSDEAEKVQLGQLPGRHRPDLVVSQAWRGAAFLSGLRMRAVFQGPGGETVSRHGFYHSENDKH
ncbi:hypothetical protein [Arenibaculum pallidiluteum]|uniref:hypothetical protein n=1 Tax=Arenibaculum pallidiluteum TaxID=2812559 RepID=UPI001A958E12|nr:hypothetical protein [Arenibaculum pallidiluteum]